MQYSVLIEPENSAPITLDSEIVKSVTYQADYPVKEDNSHQTRCVYMTIKGCVCSSETQSISLLRWLLVVADNSLWCRIEVSVMGDDNELVRKVTFPDAEVMDYYESFDVQGGVFTLRINQDTWENKNIVLE